MAYMQDYLLDIGTSGITDLRAQLFDTVGVAVGSAITTLFTDLGGGFYLWHYTAFPDGHRGGVKVYSNAAPTVPLVMGSINPEELNTDPLLSDVPDSYAEGTAGFALGTLESLSNRIGAGRITVVSPVAQSGQISLIQGDDYTLALGRALSWTENSSGWPTLTGSTITLEVEDGALIATGSIVVGTGSSKQVRVELTSAQTDLLPLGELRYCLVATFGTSRVTLARDKCIVSDREDGE
jgi:hypothetical protein